MKTENNSQGLTIGMDLGDRRYTVCILNAAGEIGGHRRRARRGVVRHPVDDRSGGTRRADRAAQDVTQAPSHREASTRRFQLADCLPEAGQPDRGSGGF